jgi:hypothetical protein
MAPSRILQLYYPNYLLIAGSGRKTGKTTLACQIIGKFSKEHEIIAIKICPHRHPQEIDTKYIARNEFYDIIEEVNPTGNKDSSRFLQAGASRVYYIQTSESHLYEAFKLVQDHVPENSPVIVESGGLRKIVKPGLYLLLMGSGEKEVKPELKENRGLADRLVRFDGEKFDFSLDDLQFDGKSWKIEKQ